MPEKLQQIVMTLAIIGTVFRSVFAFMVFFQFFLKLVLYGLALYKLRLFLTLFSLKFENISFFHSVNFLKVGICSPILLLLKEKVETDRKRQPHYPTFSSLLDDGRYFGVFKFIVNRVVHFIIFG